MGAPVTIQSNIKSNTKSFDKFGYFLGGIDVTHQNLDQFTPYIRGVSRVFLHKPPAFMLERYPDMTRRFKTYLETGYTSLDGIGDISVDFTDFIIKSVIKMLINCSIDVFSLSIVDVFTSKFRWPSINPIVEKSFRISLTVLFINGFEK